MSDNILVQLGQCIRAFYDSELQPYADCQGGYLTGIGEDQKVVLHSIIKYVVETDIYFTDLAKRYFAQYDCTRVAFAKRHKVATNTLNSQLQRGRFRFVADFGGACLLELCGRSSIGSRVLDAERVRYYRYLYNKTVGSENSLYSLLDLELGDKRGQFTDKPVDAERWAVLITVLGMYMPKQRHDVAQSITGEEVGYINNLLWDSDCQGADKERQKQLFKLINENLEYIKSVSADA